MIGFFSFLVGMSWFVAGLICLSPTVDDLPERSRARWTLAAMFLGWAAGPLFAAWLLRFGLRRLRSLFVAAELPLPRLPRSAPTRTPGELSVADERGGEVSLTKGKP